MSSTSSEEGRGAAYDEDVVWRVQGHLGEWLDAAEERLERAADRVVAEDPDALGVRLVLLALEYGDARRARRLASRTAGAVREFLDRLVWAWQGTPRACEPPEPTGVQPKGALGTLSGLVTAEVAAAQGAFSDAIAAYGDVQAASSVFSRWSRMRLAELYLDRAEPWDRSRLERLLAELEPSAAEGDTLVSLRARLARVRSTLAIEPGDPSAFEALHEVIDEARERGFRSTEARALLGLAKQDEVCGRSGDASLNRETALGLLEAMALTIDASERAAFWSVPWRRSAQGRAEGGGTAGKAQPRTAPTPNAAVLDASVERLLELIKRLAAEGDLERLLSRINESAVELSGAERGLVLLLNDGKLEAQFAHHSERADDPTVVFSRSIGEAVLLDGAPLVTVDASDDCRLSEYLSVHQMNLRSVACLPIAADGEVLGALYLEDRMRVGRFGERDVRLLQAFADQAAIALRNRKLSQGLAEANQALRQANEEVERLLEVKTEELADIRGQLDRDSTALGESSAFPEIIGRSPPMRALLKTLERLRFVDVPVVIEGESGTGKELFARTIHQSGKRSHRPFVALNCGAVPETLLESELFGHVRGAFTGASRDRRGMLARADRGTLFLDEVAEMSAKMQVDLLRFLQDGRVTPIGSERSEEVDVRVICASNRALQHEVREGRFREDLYYRINVVTLELPPLRERREDIPLLCNYLLKQVAQKAETEPKRLSPAALEVLMAAELPGNIRQLEHLLLNASVMVAGETIDAGDLALVGKPAVQGSDERGGQPAAISLTGHRQDERAQILEALEKSGWNRSEAARTLGMPRRTLYRRLKEYGILE